jgi:hypothetical protein
MRSSSAFGDQNIGGLTFGISGTRSRDDLAHINFSALTGVEGIDPGLQVRPERANLLDVVENFPADLVLVGFR